MTTATAPLLPPAQSWHTASHDRPCPACKGDIKRGDRVAHVEGVDGPRHVCGNCTSTPKPRKTR